MPYTITSGVDGFDTRYHTHRAVATLDEARSYAASAVPNVSPMAGSKAYDRAIRLRSGARNLPEQGGSITLPDGTVVRAELVTWDALAHEAGFEGDYADPEPEDVAEILDAYNARKAVS